MSIERFLAKQKQNQPLRFKDVVGKLLSEKEQGYSRPWKYEDEISASYKKAVEQQIIENEINATVESFLVHIRLLKITPSVIEHYIDYIKNECVPPIDEEHLIDEYARIIHTRLCAQMKIPVEELKNISTLESNLQQQLFTNPIAAAEIGAYIRLHFPEWKFEGDWDTLSNEVTSIRDIPMETSVVVRFLANLRILAAYKVQMTDKGIEIIDDEPADLGVSIPPRPVRKKI